jgi:hypothetical protein
MPTYEGIGDLDDFAEGLLVNWNHRYFQTLAVELGEAGRDAAGSLFGKRRLGELKDY